MGIRSLKDLEAHQGKLNHHEMIGFKHVYDFETKIPRAEMDLIKVKKFPLITNNIHYFCIWLGFCDKGNKVD